MEILAVHGETRRPGNRHANERLRRRGLVPAVIYGHGEAPENVALSLHDLEIALEHVQHVIELRTDGHNDRFLVKDVQYDHLEKTPIHVDLMRVDPNERVRVKVRIDLKGTPKGIHEGGVLVHVLTDLEVECKLLEIPESITANVAQLALGDALHVRELVLPADVKALAHAEDIIAVVRMKRGPTPEEEAAEAAAAGVAAEAKTAEPDVIGRVAKETEDESGA